MMVTLPSVDAEKSPQVSLTPNQLVSVEVLGGGPWSIVDETFPFEQNRNQHIGFGFDFSVTQESERSLALAPRKPYCAPTDDLAGTGETAKLWQLKLETSLTAPTNRIRLYMVIAPTTWTGSTTTPYTQWVADEAGAALAELLTIEEITTNSTSWVLNDAGTAYNLVWNFDFTALASYVTSWGSYTNYYNTRPFFDIINASTWNGRVDFTTRLSGAVLGQNLNWTAATFTGYVHDWHTGFMSERMDVRGRAVHDYVTGRPYMSHEAIKDDWRDGIPVHPESYDPADPLDTDYYTPPPGEGVVDDEIPDLE